MLIIFSDTHLTDGSTATNVDEGAFAYLGQAIISAARRGIDDVHVVLLGDIVDLVRTDYWHRTGVPLDQRPWGGTLSPATGMHSDDAMVERQFAEVLDLVLAQPASRALFDMLNDLPQAVREFAATVRVSYVVGNHDRVFNNYEGLRSRMAAEMPDVPVTFVNEIRLPEYGVLARHGHEWDEICHGWAFMRALGNRRRLDRFHPDAYKVMAIGEPITAELMSGLIHRTEVSLRAAGIDDPQFMSNLRELNNLRPMLHVFHWLAWFTKGGYAQYGKHLLDALRDSLNDLLESSLAKAWDRTKPDFLIWGDLTHQLGMLLDVLNTGIRFETLSDVVSGAVKIKNTLGVLARPNDGDELLDGAQEEYRREGTTSPFQYIVYGHTHEARHDCFRAWHNGAVQMYINTGTYLPFIERTRTGEGYCTSHQMSMAFFYKAGEDTHTQTRTHDGPTISVWNGIRRK